MKNQEKMQRTLNITVLILCAALTAGVMFLFNACGAKEDGTWMSCHWAQMSVFYSGLAMTLLSAALFKIKNTKAVLAVRVLILALAVLVMLLPQTIIPLCIMSGMRCRALMRPCAILLAAVIFLVEGIALLQSLRKKAK